MSRKSRYKDLELDSESTSRHGSRSVFTRASCVASHTRSSERGINLASSQLGPQALSGRLLRLPVEGTTVSEEGNRVKFFNGFAACSLTVPRVTVSMIRVLCANSGASESVSKRTSGPAGVAAADIWPAGLPPPAAVEIRTH